MTDAKVERLRSAKLDDRALSATPPAPYDGLATYLRTIKSYTPLGTAADAANIQALMTAMAGVGEVRIKAGTATLTSVGPGFGERK